MRAIIHADMDAFYASVEQRDRPEMRGKPVVVGGTSDRGVVSAASYEARKFGVRSAMPSFEARQRCPQAVCWMPDMAGYAAVSAQLHEIFQRYTPQVEGLALDEAFLDVTASQGLFGKAEVIAQRLRQEVRSELGLAMTCGVASNKLVAKMACADAKPDGLRIIADAGNEAYLATKEVRRLWGVGPVTERELLRREIRTLGELVAAPGWLLEAVFGRHAEAMRLRAKGVDTRAVEPEHEAKSCGEECTFDSDVQDHERIRSALVHHAHAVASRLREQGLWANTVAIKVKLGRPKGAGDAEASRGTRFPTLQRQLALAHSTQEAKPIAQAALSLWDALCMDTLAKDAAIRLIGLTARGLDEAAEPAQLDLFASAAPGANTPAANTPARALSSMGTAVDAIRERFGADAIRVASAASKKVMPADPARASKKKDA